MLVLAVSLAVASFLDDEMLLQDNLSDMDVVIDREQERGGRPRSGLRAGGRTPRPGSGRGVGRAIIVEDRGPGIPAEIRDEVFAPFVRAGETPSSTGLGLSVVQAVVEAHGGGVDVRTNERGTAVRLRLPWSPDEDEDVDADVVDATGDTDADAEAEADVDLPPRPARAATGGRDDG